MSAHLAEHEMTAAVAGLDLDEAAREHLRSCLVCRQEVRAMEQLFGQRRQQLLDDEPDWDAQHAAIMAHVPASAEVVPIERHWRRPVLAAAASLLLAVGAAVLYVQQRAVEPAIGSDRAEQILAEVEATLDSDEIPGFEALGDTFFAVEESEGAVDDGDSTAWDVALAALEDDQVNYEVPGFEALGMLVPTIEDLESMVVEDSDSTATKRRKRA